MSQEIIVSQKSLVLEKEEQKTLAAYFSSFESKLTSREYLIAAREFFSVVGCDLTALSELKRDHLIFYQSWLRNKGQARKTILKKMSAISSLCKHLAFEGIVERDLSYGIKRPPQSNKRETADFTDSEVRKIFECLDPTRRCFTSHRAILAVGFYTGLRSSEIRYLKVENLTEVRGHRVLSLTIKGNKPHEIPLTPFCFNAIDEHLDFLKTLGVDRNEPNQWIFPSLSPFQNRPMSATGLRQVLHSKLKEAGIPLSGARRYSPHSMRATLASHLLNEKEIPLEQVQHTLGHSSPTTTQKYNKRQLQHDRSPLYKVDY